MTTTKTQKRAAKTKRGPRLVDTSKIPAALKRVDERCGVRRGDHLMMTSFRHPNATPEVIDAVREMYRHRWFGQHVLAEMFDLSQTLVSKIVRTDPFWRS